MESRHPGETSRNSPVRFTCGEGQSESCFRRLIDRRGGIQGGRHNGRKSLLCRARAWQDRSMFVRSRQPKARSLLFDGMCMFWRLFVVSLDRRNMPDLLESHQ
jgi:hypothetical protein